MSEHTKEPWTYQKAANYEGFSIAPKGTMLTLAAVQFCHGGKVIMQCHNFPGETEANARRIVACVNACQAFTTEQLEDKKFWLLLAANPDAMIEVPMIEPKP